MKYLVFVWLFIAQSFLIQTAVAEEVASATTAIPTMEQDFVKSINQFTKAQIIEQFGEPAKADDVKVKGTGKIVASIWLYHFINTAADGSYYETTELDFIDDKVVMVAFLKNDGSEGPEATQQYEVPLKQ
ncbi:hypothetical protein [Methylotenera sp.]|jgi:hypothetical protein|uniref:DUF3887 domain-containing protein n=1 Tax=Methylotenera mobilis TaxID=359408 RepID=A0A351RC85_9PROT|nr:hypothetical protein [Methylotenera sp.]MDP3211991.1 hypothetical protein [Methylotenera sp.]HBA09656.1 hypothetical protein [Methylotenera mobilis]